jgi:hypothetical protein
MRYARLSGPIAATVALMFAFSPAQAQDESRTVADGGIKIPGWMGKIDAREAERGLALENARLAMDGDAIHVVTGPAVNYWNPSNTASGDFTVTATFTEMEYMSLNNHPHPYGIFIGGSDMGTDNQSLLYCAAYGDGRFIVRGFGPAPFAMNGRQGETNDVVNKAAGKGQPVTQEIALSVRGDMVQCSINGTVVASYPKADVIGEGKLKSTDGVYGIRFAHNTEARVSGLTMTR